MGTAPARVIHRADGRKAAPAARTPPRAPVRAMQVIETLAASPDAMPLAALAATLQLPKTSTMHLLRALEAAGYVRRTGSGFRLGAATYRLASCIPVPDDFEEAALEVMREVLAATQETVLLGALSDDGTTCMYTMRLGSPQPVRFAPEVGEKRPLHATGLGKVLLACGPADLLERYLASTTLKRITPRTTGTRTALRRQLAQVRADGFSTSIDEMVEGGSALAAPVFDAGHKCDLALVIAAPTSRLLARRALLEAALKQGAEQLRILRVSMQAGTSRFPAVQPRIRAETGL